MKSDKIRITLTLTREVANEMTSAIENYVSRDLEFDTDGEYLENDSLMGDLLNVSNRIANSVNKNKRI